MWHICVRKIEAQPLANDNCWNFKGARLRKLRSCQRMTLWPWNCATTTTNATTTSVK